MLRTLIDYQWPLSQLQVGGVGAGMVIDRGGDRLTRSDHLERTKWVRIM